MVYLTRAWIQPDPFPRFCIYQSENTHNQRKTVILKKSNVRTKKAELSKLTTGTVNPSAFIHAFHHIFQLAYHRMRQKSHSKHPCQWIWTEELTHTHTHAHTHSYAYANTKPKGRKLSAVKRKIQHRFSFHIELPVKPNWRLQENIYKFQNMFMMVDAMNVVGFSCFFPSLGEKPCFPRDLDTLIQLV